MTNEDIVKAIQNGFDVTEICSGYIKRIYL